MSQEERNLVYMTPEEFANIILQSLYDGEYFKEGELAHPEDLMYNFESMARTIVTTMNHFQSKVMRSRAVDKKAMMQTGNLSKGDKEDSYSEWKYRAFK